MAHYNLFVPDQDSLCLFNKISVITTLTALLSHCIFIQMKCPVFNNNNTSSIAELVDWGASPIYFLGGIKKKIAGHKVVGLVWVRGGQKVGSSQSEVAQDDVTEISQW